MAADVIGPSVLTLVRNRGPHLDQLVEGLRRSVVTPAELIVVDMSDAPLPAPVLDCPVTVLRIETDGLPLARARNLAAAAARSPHLLFLDVDCIPLAGCLGRMTAALAAHDALLCADVRYLGPGDAAPGWREIDLLERGAAHPVRSFPADGTIRREDEPGLFWSLAFAIRAERFAALGGFDEAFTGYGAEDTDFGFRAAAAGVELLFVGGAIACHQHHGGHDPPVQHLDDILRNAETFRRRWGTLPMEGWIDAFEDMGLAGRSEAGLVRLRGTTSADLVGTQVTGRY